jgi:glycerol-3-phosphate acyltransferase PlsX
MAIILDAMGSDTYPEPEIEAAIIAAETFGEEIILVGNQDLIAPKLAAALQGKKVPVRIHHAPDLVEMSDKPVAGTQSKPLNSMAVSLELLKQGEASAFVTAGNTGAAFFNAIKILGRFEGLKRPALLTTIPTRKGKSVFLDMGANADCRPEFLVEFAVLGSVYAEIVMKIDKPRIGLLANGEESGKGNNLVRETHVLLKQCKLNFCGNVEPKEVFKGEVDVVVTDGFTGNIFIKDSEAVAKMIMDIIKDKLMSSIRGKIGGVLVKPSLKSLLKIMDPAEVGAGLLIGVNGYVFIGHGRSDSRSLVSAIRNTRQIVQSGLLVNLKKAIQERLVQVQ